MSRDRRNFYVKGMSIPAGEFVGNSYPTLPGRYQFVPYRGPGHLKFAQALEKNGVVVCKFTSGLWSIHLVITAEEFVQEPSACRWFVQISKIRRFPRKLVLLIALLIACLVLLFKS